MPDGLISNNHVSNNLGFPDIRRLGADDLRACAALAVDRGWWPERAKWLLLLEASEAYGVDASDGRGLAGSVVLTRWGADVAAIGMMLTASRYGGQGLGRALMEHVLRVAGDDTAVSLFGTDAGRPLYEKLGFKPVRRSIAFRGHFHVDPQTNSSKKRAGRAEAAGAAALAESSGDVRLATEADLSAILALDLAVYGADRTRILARLPAFAERIVVLEASEGIVGYAAAWRTEAYLMIGPLLAPDGAAARRLVTELAADSTVAVRLDLDPDRPELPGWARAHGLEPTERTVFMTRGDLTPRGISEHRYTPISVAMA
jgi:GNAT superfamily N-acetyltransferase